MNNIRWNTSAFKVDIIHNLLLNGEIVGKFVETEAKKRIVSIQFPDWGFGYRRYVSMIIRNEVEVVGNAVEIRVGVPAGRTLKSGKQSHHLGFYIELGSATAPTHPYLRPAVFENAKTIVSLLEGK